MYRSDQIDRLKSAMRKAVTGIDDYDLEALADAVLETLPDDAEIKSAYEPGFYTASSYWNDAEITVLYVNDNGNFFTSWILNEDGNPQGHELVDDPSDFNLKDKVKLVWDGGSQ